MYRILKHVVDEVRVGFYEIIKDLKYFQILFLSFEESAECHVITVEFDGLYGLKQFLAVSNNGLVSLLHLLLFLLQTLELLVNLLLHHRVEILLLNL